MVTSSKTSGGSTVSCGGDPMLIDGSLEQSYVDGEDGWYFDDPLLDVPLCYGEQLVLDTYIRCASRPYDRERIEELAKPRQRHQQRASAEGSRAAVASIPPPPSSLHSGSMEVSLRPAEPSRTRAEQDALANRLSKPRPRRAEDQRARGAGETVVLSAQQDGAAGGPSVCSKQPSRQLHDGDLEALLTRLATPRRLPGARSPTPGERIVVDYNKRFHGRTVDPNRLAELAVANRRRGGSLSAWGVSTSGAARNVTSSVDWREALVRRKEKPTPTAGKDEAETIPRAVSSVPMSPRAVRVPPPVAPAPALSPASPPSMSSSAPDAEGGMPASGDCGVKQLASSAVRASPAADAGRSTASSWLSSAEPLSSTSPSRGSTPACPSSAANTTGRSGGYGSPSHGASNAVSRCQGGHVAGIDAEEVNEPWDALGPLSGGSRGNQCSAQDSMGKHVAERVGGGATARGSGGADERLDESGATSIILNESLSAPFPDLDADFLLQGITDVGGFHDAFDRRRMNDFSARHAASGQAAPSDPVNAGSLGSLYGGSSVRDASRPRVGLPGADVEVDARRSADDGFNGWKSDTTSRMRPLTSSEDRGLSGLLLSDVGSGFQSLGTNLRDDSGASGNAGRVQGDVLDLATAASHSTAEQAVTSEPSSRRRRPRPAPRAREDPARSAANTAMGQ
eukprot:TRINITY_DN47056_c0_g1_i1.p1 TRINITY_DN47056_c0_g1~~TRINITY_DN47056_c0_g1_i1.p1  ORF type:complete len:681 (-),score=111.22 TRINITY_DN47056_c0_g1_i1:95-2137(-)